MIYIILITFFTAILSPFICHLKLSYLGWLLAIIPATFFLLFLAQIPSMMRGDIIISSIPWIPKLAINLEFYLDGLSLLFVLLITGIGTLIVIYSFPYLKNHPQLGRYYCYLFFFMGAMLGTVLASNLIVLFVFWELTSLSSYLLISFNHSNQAARRAALQGLLITAGGGLALLVGFLIIGAITSQFSFISLLTNSTALLKSPFYIVIVLLILLGAFTKSAQYPFHFWLPNAMQAPTPISAYLHSATMVKLGIYLVARLTPVLGHTPLWIGVLTLISSLTMLSSAILALRATDLKLILAYSTIMALGSLFFLLASGSPATIEAAMIFLLAHAIYKAALFLNVGCIEHKTGTRELPALQGLIFLMPISFLSVLLSAISMAGLPPVIGFISKEIIYNAKLAEPNFSTLLTAIAFVTNIIFVVISLLITFKPFLGKSSHWDHSTIKPHEVGLMLWGPSLLLGLVGLLLGLYPWLIDGELIAPAVGSILQQPATIEFALWHGLSPALLLSLITFFIAIILFYSYQPINYFLRNLSWINWASPQNCYEKSIKLLNYTAVNLVQIIQSGLLRVYIAVTCLTLSVLLSITYFHFNSVALSFSLQAPWFGWLLISILIIAALAIIFIGSYLASLALLGIIGLSSTLIFLIYSAPDVAMTQLLVDVLTIVIVVLALYRSKALPTYKKLTAKISFINIIVALFLGSTITILLLSIIRIPLNLAVNNYYIAHSLIAAHGKNVVNVILVDFRAFDTLGEVIVIAMAGLGVYGLLKTYKDDEGAK